MFIYYLTLWDVARISAVHLYERHCVSDIDSFRLLVLTSCLDSVCLPLGSLSRTVYQTSPLIKPSCIVYHVYHHIMYHRVSNPRPLLASER